MARLWGKPLSPNLKSTIDLKTFSNRKDAAITGFAFEMNTDDTKGGAAAFIKKIVFYSEH
jgi:hypothetical protein